MINLSKSGNTIVFVFDNNDHYLQQGTIEVPVNSLSLVTDNSQMATFKKAASNDIFVSALYSDFGMTKEQLISFYKDNMVGGGGGDIPTEEIQEMIDESLSSATSGYADSVIYNSTSHYVEFYHNGTGGTKVYEFDASDFIVDGMIDDVRIETISGTSYLVIDFNTASGKEDIQIPLTDIFDPSNYYTKSEVDSALSGKADTTAVTEAISEAVSGKADTSAVTESINAAVSGKADTTAVTEAISEAISGKADTSAVTESINAAVSGKVDTSTFETYSGNVETELGNKLDSSAYTPFNLPIYQGRSENSLSLTQESGTTQYYNNVSGYSATAIGAGLVTANLCETAVGLHNKNTNVLYGTPFGNSGATLFSVGNGGGANDRHNAIEVKQNGDIYIANTNDTSYAEYYNKPMVKLQDVLDGKQDTLSAGTNITISGNVISAEGGGKAVSGGTNISVTTGETADTINCTLPISGTSEGIYTTSSYPFLSSALKSKNAVFGENNSIDAFGSSARSYYNAMFGSANKIKIKGSNNFFAGSENETDSIYEISYSTVFGYKNRIKNSYEFASGRLNISSDGVSSAATLFSVGNGYFGGIRHNAFEIKNNGDIYIADTNDTTQAEDYNKPMIKLQDALSGGSITVSSAITSGDTNAVAGGAVYDKFDEVETVTAAALNDLNDKFGGLKLQKVTQAEYDALVSGGTVDNNTLYVVV